MRTKLNLVTAFILQIITIISGLIIPRLTIITFGSSVNGMVSSISQFLSFISLLEGGLGAVVLAELYKPIEDKKIEKINSILSACNSFFKKLSIAFVIYTIFLMIFYPLFFSSNKNYGYVSGLIFILSLSTLVQYMLSITYSLMLQADQKIYICNIVSSITILFNLIVSVIVIRIFPNIHIMKLFAGLVYFLQPIIYRKYFFKKYPYKIRYKSNYKLKNKWSGFSQNLAHYITMNTDIMVLTVFASFKDISIYSVYMLPLNALRLIISSVANSYQSNLGKLIATDDKMSLKNTFSKFETILWISSLILFGSCLLLVNGFVNIYTTGINDANYYQPFFAYIMVIAQMLYCGRESYRLLVLSAGKFKETNIGAIVEAIINISVSLILINLFGLVGVAIGTCISIVYRLLFFIIFLKKDLCVLELKKICKEFLLIIFIVIVNSVIYYYIPFTIKNIFQFFIYGIVVVIFEISIVIISGKVIKLF